MAELQTVQSGGLQTRVEDYLSDKIQTAADLEQVDSLLQRVQEQQGLLQKQVGLVLASATACLQSNSWKMPGKTFGRHENESTTDPTSCERKLKRTAYVKSSWTANFKSLQDQILAMMLPKRSNPAWIKCAV